MRPKEHRCGHPVRRYRSALDTTCARPEGHPGQHMSGEAWRRKYAGRRGGEGQGLRVSAHGYAGYTRGCRCDACTDAKAAYMRQRRVSAYTAGIAAETDLAVTHGTRFAYEERGCRCDACVAAERRAGRLRRAVAA